MVRPLSAVWNHFKVESPRGKKIAKCRYCHFRYLVPNATKMAKHIEKCSKKPGTVSVPVYPKEEEIEYDPSVILGSQEMIVDTESMHTDPGLSNSSNSSFTSLPTIYVASNISTNSDKPNALSTKTTSKTCLNSALGDEFEKLDLAFARAIYSSNVPLSSMDNYYWQTFFKQLRPSYEVPSEYDLSNRLLDKEYEDIKHFVKQQIDKADFVTIVTDGWSNIHNEGIVCYIVTTPMPIFYKSVEVKEKRHTAEYIAHELIKVINEVGAGKVSGLVTDNTSNMKAAWKIVQAKYSHIFITGCVAHGLNLLLSDIYKIGTFQRIILKAKDVVNYVKNKKELLSVFTSKQRLKKDSPASTLKLPAETRWCSAIIMFESLLNGKESLQEAVLMEGLDIVEDIRQLVLDNDIFWASIYSLVHMLRPICDGIKVIESDNATLSDVPHVFSGIKKSLASLVSTPLQMEEEEEVKSMVEARCAMFCQPMHYAAYLLDPRYSENNLLSDDFKSAVDFISNYPSKEPVKILADFAQFKSQQSIYSNDSVWGSAKLITPFVWWKGFFKDRCLSSIALHLFNIPPSIAACERIFLAFSKTRTSLRNSLTDKRVSKLISINYNLNLKSKHLFGRSTDESE